MPVKILIIGCGPGNPEQITLAALRAVESADVIAGADRLCDFFPEFKGRRLLLGPGGVDGLLAEIAEEIGVVAVLVSGDPGLYSLAARITGRFGRTNCEIIPGISSVQFAFARLGTVWEDTQIVSLHNGGTLPEAGTLRERKRIALLAGNSRYDSAVIELARELECTHRIQVCHDLSLPQELIQPVTSDNIERFLGNGRVLVLFLAK